MRKHLVFIDALFWGSIASYIISLLTMNQKLVAPTFATVLLLKFVTSYKLNKKDKNILPFLILGTLVLFIEAFIS